MKKLITGMLCLVSVFMFANSKVAANTDKIYWNVEGESLYDAVLPYVDYSFQNDANFISTANLWCTDTEEDHMEGYDSLEECQEAYISDLAQSRLSIEKVNFINSSQEYTEDYYISVDLSKNSDEVTAYVKMSEGYLTEVDIVFDGTLYLNPNSSHLFNEVNFLQLESIDGLNYVNTSEVTDMSYMFSNTWSLETLDLSKFNTSNVTNMSHMFYESGMSNINLNNFNTSEVTDMSYMFARTSRYSKSFNSLDLTNFNTSNVTNMEGMFNGNSDLTEIYVSSNFKTDKLSKKNVMFINCDNLVGQSGTVYDVSEEEEDSYFNASEDSLPLILKASSDYAKIDTNQAPGYFSTHDIEYYSFSSILDQTYTGEEITPNVTVTKGSTTLVKDEDYEVSYSNNTNVGTAAVTITGIGNYTGEKELTFKINPISLTGATIENIGNQTYTGEEITPNVTVTKGSTTLVKDEDYEVSYSNNTNVGTATVTITGIGNYTGEKQKTFTINPTSIEEATIGNIDDQAYTGEEITPSITVTKGSTTLVKDTDYELEYEDNIEPGAATVIITGIGNYTGEKQKTFVISSNIEDAVVTGLEGPFEYTGEEIEPELTLTFYGKELVEDTDYELEYKDTINATTNYTGSDNKKYSSEIVITGLGKYTGTKYVYYNIEKPDISTKISIEGISDYEYTGGDRYQDELDYVVYYDDRELTEGTDYEVSYEDYINAGTAKMIITGINNYKGSYTVEYEINKANLLEVAEVSEVSNYNYTGSAITPNVTVSYENDTLVKGTDYTVTYSNNINAGTATIKVTGIGNYTGEIIKTFKINPISLGNATVSTIGEKVYTGSTIKPNLTVKYGNKTLVNGTDYTVIYTDNINTGRVTVKVIGKGNYKDTITKYFTIIPTKVTGLKVKSQTTNSITVAWNKTNGNVTGYAIYQYNTKTKKWDLKVKTTTNTYTFKGLAVGTTYSYKVRAYKTIDGIYKYGDYSAGLGTTTKPSAPTQKKLTTKNKSVTIKWKKVTRATGYEVYMKSSKNGKYSKIKTTNKLSFKKTKLKRNKKYYFKVRSYRTVLGVKVYSGYSKVKSIKVK